MQFFSTNGSAEKVNFRDATITGQPPDKGLYFPEFIPVFSKAIINDAAAMSREEIAFEVIRPYVGDSLPSDVLEAIVEETISFDIPLVPVTDSIYSLELFHGPTLAFKDIGARFMSRCLGNFVQGLNKKLTVLVATSGDTGGAVANGFYNVDGIDVVILFPFGKVSGIQELQLTTLGKNVRALEVEGSFDDCQRMVKEIFADKDLNQQLFLTSANSINVARWLPQQFYYLFAWQQWNDKENPPVVSVPSGNFGNICAGLLANASGLPVRHFIAACNANDVVPEFLQTGNYLPKATRHTLSNAMDVGNPSNFVRIMELFQQNRNRLKKVFSAISVSDDETEKTIVEISKAHNYTLDPHGAVGYLALSKYLDEHKNDRGYFLETAHPVKFYDVMEKIIHHPLPLPESVKHLLTREKKSTRITADTDQLRAFLLG